jgi:hypothetical protein
MFQVMENNRECLPYLHHLDSYVRCDEILLWLIKNKLTGKNFIEWSKTHFGASMLRMTQFVLGKLEKVDKTSILYGRDLV